MWCNIPNPPGQTNETEKVFRQGTGCAGQEQNPDILESKHSSNHQFLCLLSDDQYVARLMIIFIFIKLFHFPRNIVWSYTHEDMIRPVAQLRWGERCDRTGQQCPRRRQNRRKIEGGDQYSNWIKNLMFCAPKKI